MSASLAGRGAFCARQPARMGSCRPRGRSQRFAGCVLAGLDGPATRWTEVADGPIRSGLSEVGGAAGGFHASGVRASPRAVSRSTRRGRPASLYKPCPFPASAFPTPHPCVPVFHPPYRPICPPRTFPRDPLPRSFGTFLTGRGAAGEACAQGVLGARSPAPRSPSLQVQPVPLCGRIRLSAAPAAYVRPLVPRRRAHRCGRDAARHSPA